MVRNFMDQTLQVVLEQTPRLVENFAYEATNSEQPD